MAELPVIILEEASLELLPKKLYTSPGAKNVEKLFGIEPRMQILDANFHRQKIMPSILEDAEKRGRPDVVHYALLDITSTPLYAHGKFTVVIHARGGDAIILHEGTRPPRTLQRFCGVMAKLLARNEGPIEKKLFSIERDKKNFKELLSLLQVEECISFTRLGTRKELSKVVLQEDREKRRAYIVGGFAHGHFKEGVTQNSDEIISISNDSLPAHVVTARLCYELEKNYSFFE